MEINEITEKLEEFESEMLRLKKRNKQLEELARAQQDRLNNIYEASAKAQYEAKLWVERYRYIERWVQKRLEITPASIQYDRMRLKMLHAKKLDLHEIP